MASYKLLIDTNIFIGLEDPKQIDAGFAEFNRQCAKHNVQIFVHEAAVEDIRRDRNADRREVSLSKLKKFQSLSGIKLPPREKLEEKFGGIHGANDEVDVALLVALDIGAIDFVVTQDKGIHTRVKTSPLEKRVLLIPDALLWLQQTFEPKLVELPLVLERRAHEIDLSDEIFDSLREGYGGFDKWWQEKCVREHRSCWVVELGKVLAGICVWKQELKPDATVTLEGEKILKLCTFKVKPEFRGEKLGELLLKQALWFAQLNGYDLVYLTTQPEQISLIQIIEYFGFQNTLTLNGNERVYEKPLSRDRLLANANEDTFEIDRLNYPRFVTSDEVSGYYVPIKGEYHRKLFPEIAIQSSLPLFPGQILYQAGSMEHRTPGNTIRKVYLCRAQASQFKPGDILFFYESVSKSFEASQSITSVGVFEALHITHDVDELVRLTAKRSVFSEDELRSMVQGADTPIKVIDFLLVGHFDKPISLRELVDLQVLPRRPPQSIAKLSNAAKATLVGRLTLGFEA